MAASKKTICAFVFMLMFPLIAFAGERDEPRLVTVNGDAEVKVAPDEVIITLGIETWDEDLSVAKNDNNRIVAKILETAKKKGIEEKHIQTDHISIEPRYRDQWEHRTFIGYFVRKTVVVTLRDVDKFEPLLSSFLDAGANYVHGIQFRTTELRKHRDKARSLAINAAREKASRPAVLHPRGLQQLVVLERLGQQVWRRDDAERCAAGRRRRRFGRRGQHRPGSD
jgi:uncharacterized protein YggE